MSKLIMTVRRLWERQREMGREWERQRESEREGTRQNRMKIKENAI